MRGCGLQVDGLPNPSFLSKSVVYKALDGAVHLLGDIDASGVDLTGNVLYRSYDTDTLRVSSGGNTVRGNLALGTVKVGGQGPVCVCMLSNKRWHSTLPAPTRSEFCLRAQKQWAPHVPARREHGSWGTSAGRPLHCIFTAHCA